MELDLTFMNLHNRKREITMRNTNARKYSERIQKRSRKRKECIETCILFLVVSVLMLCIFAKAFDTPNRYAVPSETENGIHYTYVEEVKP